VVISLIEIAKHKENMVNKYTPSINPYAVFWVILLLNIVFRGQLEHLKYY
jgi:hypothetical protein